MEKYFLKADHEENWKEVTKAQFINAERNAGFRPKDGDGVATGGFGGNGMNGKVENVPDNVAYFLYDIKVRDFGSNEKEIMKWIDNCPLNVDCHKLSVHKESYLGKRSDSLKKKIEKDDKNADKEKT
ncbi:MAG: hypothetical protein ACTSRU_20535 [Candidatus Hodarchaeales archaeon]